MKQAKFKDKRLVVDILSESFEGNKSVLSVVGNDKRKIPALMSYSFEKGMIGGEVWLNDQNTAALIALYPYRNKLFLRSLILDIELLFTVIGFKRLLKILKREKKVKAKQPKSDFIHLWYIGVSKTNQNSGIGSRMLQRFIDLKKFEGLPLYLETSTMRNLNFYKKNGFQLVDKIENELPYTLYIFSKYPE